MPVITVNDQHYALRPGQNRLGAGSNADVRVSDDDSLGVQAIVDLRGSAHPVIRRAVPTASVSVNGVPLVDPTPLMHGDKVDIGGTELLYSDDTKTGATQFVAASEIAAIASSPAPTPSGPLSGARLVSMVDGKEYVVGNDGVTIGRDASNTVVVAQDQVSRKHATIVRTENGGYEIRDASANGVFVNKKRVKQTRALAPSDIIRIGSEEFRFRAEPVKSAAAPRAPRDTPRPEVHSMRPPAPPARRSTPQAPSAATVARETTAPLSPQADARRPLAVLRIVNVGPMNGRQFDVRVPLAHIGRGAHNDIALADESVSDNHAKLQRREDGWYVSDLQSTNGTYVNGERFSGERRLEGPAQLRFGGVKMVFEPTDADATPAKNTRAIASFNRPQLNATTSTPSVILIPAEQPAEQRQSIPAWVWGAMATALIALAVFFLLIR